MSDYSFTSIINGEKINKFSNEFELGELLDTNLSVKIKIDTKNKSLDIPNSLRTNNYIILEIGYNLYPFVQTILLYDTGFFAEVFFNSVPYTCYVPWESVIGYSGPAVHKLISNRKYKTPRDENGKVIRPSWLRVIK